MNYKGHTPLRTVFIAAVVSGFFVWAFTSNIFKVTSSNPETKITTLPVDQGDSLNLSWKKLTILGCSTRHSEVEYSLNIPSKATYSKLTQDENRTVYQVLDEGLDMKINCDTAGIGSVICVDGGIKDVPFTLKEKYEVNGCFWKDTLSGKYTVSDVYRVGADSGSLEFNFSNASKALVDKILSTLEIAE